jgi:transcriptional regulator with XRE-family HTH domain
MNEVTRQIEHTGLTRKELAQLLGVTRTSLWRWESGKQPAPKWLVLALEGIEKRLLWIDLLDAMHEQKRVNAGEWDVVTGLPGHGQPMREDEGVDALHEHEGAERR